ncbi:bacterial proteasome activator family protein [Nostocoides sp. HKS02]|uniref:bacterial proteasome activator family protein n=1 Tax=Nostocoides sp. HKS02 TaxID=1813880 RepID=UPI0018A8122C|nr:bacterial proteasome activator family protein [Tetrasphaera sp. HKS02]
MTEQPQQPQPDDSGADQPRVVVVTQDGMGVAPHSEEHDGPTNPADLVEQPAKVMRIGSMIKQLLEEVRNAPLDDAGRVRLAEIHRRSIKELEDGLAPELIDELERIALPFNEDHAPTDAELRIAQAQLVGWLEGLFHGIQTALFAQQMAAQQQLAQMRRALPPGHAPDGTQGMPGMPGGPGAPGMPGDDQHSGPTGQYL